MYQNIVLQEPQLNTLQKIFNAISLFFSRKKLFHSDALFQEIKEDIDKLDKSKSAHPNARDGNSEGV